MSIIDEVCAPDNMNAAWRRVSARRGVWSPGTAMRRVTASPVLPMLTLLEALRDGSYEPDTPARITIRKADGHLRELCVFTLRDRLVQRALLAVLQRRTNPNMSRHSFGFRPGLGVGAALAAATNWVRNGCTWFCETDIQRCFESIRRHALLAAVERRTQDPAAAALVARCMGWRTADQLGTLGIPAGAPLSPWLCNIYLWDLDDALERECVPCVRFADDLLMPTWSRRLAHTALALCLSSLQALGLAMHPLKTSIVPCQAGVAFLGARVVRPLALSWSASAAGA